ncbi:MAG: FtsX-like permease family protein [Propionibacteriaceae bacterium]|nr:FtsX-like permease family protein [Propionibacteriaceae bacterium]
MLRAAWKSLLGRKLRLLLSALSIVLGVAFVAGSLMFTNMLNSSFQQILKSALGDVVVSSSDASSVTRGISTARVLISPETLNEITAVDGVVKASPVVSANDLYALDKNDRVLSLTGTPGIAINYIDTPAVGGLTGARIIEGRVPEADDEVAIDPSTLTRGGYSIGETLRIATPDDGIKAYRIVGTATFGQGATAGATYQFFTLTEMQRLAVEGEDLYTSVWVQTDQSRNQEVIRAAVAEVLPEGLNAALGEKLADDVEQQLGANLGFVNIFLLVFAGIALLVASLLILNTFSILVAQRSRELALLRAIGAKRSQVMRSVLLEAAIVGLLGGVLGVGAGYGLVWGLNITMSRFGIGLGEAQPELTWQIVVTSIVLALLVTVVAAIVPARRASRTRPVEAMAQTESEVSEALGLPAWFGLALVQLGAAVLICGLWLEVPKPLWWVGGGAAALLVGVVLAAATVGHPILWLAGVINGAMFKEIGKLATRNASRQPRRTSATAATLMIGLALVSTIAILAQSTTTSVRNSLTETQRGDFVLSSVNFRYFAADLDQIQAVPGIESVWTYSQAMLDLGREQPVMITGTSPEGVTEGNAVNVLAGQLNSTGGSVLIDYQLSKDLDLPLGKTFEVPGLDGAPVELLVTGIIDGENAPPPLAKMVTNQETFDRVGNPTRFAMIKVSVAEGADANSVRQGLLDATADQPTVVVTDNAEYANARVAQFNTLFAIIYALLALGVIISALGIVNTLGLSVMERTREIGLLRAVGLTRRQLRRMVRLEAVVIAVLGSLLGVVLGLVFGYALVTVLPDIPILAIPWWQLAAFVAAAAIVGVISAIGPARRAARMNVLTAVAAE